MTLKNLDGDALLKDGELAEPQCGAAGYVLDEARDPGGRAALGLCELAVLE